MTPENAAKIVNERRYTLNEAAAALEISRSSVQRLRNSGALKYKQIGGKVVISESQLAEYLAEADRQKLPAPRRGRKTRANERCA